MMGSQKPRVIRLSELAPPTNFDALSDELDGRESKEEKKPQRLNVVGSIKEKGFSVDPLPRQRISLPQPRVTPFPVARHRSDGPHWAPPSSKKSSETVIEFSEDHEGVERSAAEMAVPLSRRKPEQSLTSKWKSSLKSELTISSQTQNEFDDTRQQSRPLETSIGAIERRDYGGQQMESRKVVEVVANEKGFIATPTHRGQSMNGASQNLGLEEVSSNVQSDAALAVETGKLGGQRPSPMVVEDRIDMGRADSKAGEEATQSGLNVSTDLDIDTENRKALFAMSAGEVAEAQAELSQKLRPELLELLRRRGAEKERKRLAERTGTVSEGRTRPVGLPGHKKDNAEPQSSSPAEDIKAVASIQRGVKRMTLSDDRTASKRAEIIRGTTVGPADLLNAAPSFGQQEMPSSEVPGESIRPPPTTDPWTLRVEAVRSMRFDLDGSLVSVVPSPQISDTVQLNIAAGVFASGMHSSLSVVERDYLRTEGDPVGAGYALKETLALVRSTVPGQRAVALHLIASVLDKAIQGLQDQRFNPTSALHSEGAGGRPDWQAIWAYALGPEAELVLTLRLALDDGHSTVVAACARAIQALLSYSANESYFDSLEVLWPGQKAVYTAPVFRRKTKQDEGFIGGGRWKYNAKISEMFPFSNTAAQQKSEEDGKETVADDSHVSNKDVAAGLIRMGILPRVRYLLEVDQLIAAEEALLNVLICLARHSPTAASAVMTCPRLIDAILQRFIGTDEFVSQESWSSRVKALRLLKVLSQAKKANCVHFERIGALQTIMAPLLQQGYVNDNPGFAGDLDHGYYEIMIETVRFWRVCIDYGIGLPFFSDCYPTLCFWLLPLSKQEILTAGKDEPLLLAMESYLLLEHIARTLPSLHASGDLMNQVDGVNWSWSVAQAMLDTAIKWLSPESILGVQVLLEQCILAPEKQSQGTIKMKSSTRRLLGILTSVLHFLATVCEKVVTEKELHCALEAPENLSLPWLPTFLPNLGLTLARSGLLDYSQMDMQAELPKSTLQSDMSLSARESDLGEPAVMKEMPCPTLEKKVTFLDCLNSCQTQADNDSALVAINCLNALVRVNSVVDSLIYISKPNASPPLEGQTLAHKVLEQGLLLSAEPQLRNLLDLCKENVTSRKDLQMSVRGGPAPGMGIGWGGERGGAWSKEVMIAQASARLALDLMTVFSSRVWLSHSDRDGHTRIERSERSQQLLGDLCSNINFGLSVIGTSTTVTRELVLRACSSIIFHPLTLSILKQKIEEALDGWRDRIAEEDVQFESQPAEEKIWDQDNLSNILLKHCENFWLASKTRKGQQDVPYKVASKRKSNGLGSNLATVQEESGEDSIPHPESLMIEWVGQRLPLPSHWFLSPMVGNIPLSTKNDLENGTQPVGKETAELEEVIKAGLAFFLGFEFLTAKVPEAHSIDTKIPLVRKLHSLSTVFVSGGDVFLDPSARDLIGALQSVLGYQIGQRSANLPQTSTVGRRASGDENASNGNGFLAASVVQDQTVPGDKMEREPTMTEEYTMLDFEGSIDASYLTYAETLAEQFVATSYGDLVFGRQVAFHLCLYVPAMIRLATWRVLTDGRVLELLPDLPLYAGPPRLYLSGIEGNQQMLESFVAAWSSGALDRAAKGSSLSWHLVLYHLSRYLFETPDTEETLLLKQKIVRALVRSTVRKSDRQDMLARLVDDFVRGGCMCGSSSDVQPSVEDERILKLRLSLLWKACEGDSSLTAAVQQLQERLLRVSIRIAGSSHTSRMDGQ
ncbi:unnamed protein product [Calypogeia fissa]